MMHKLFDYVVIKETLEKLIKIQSVYPNRKESFLSQFQYFATKFCTYISKW